jgi:hypothetical protein
VTTSALLSARDKGELVLAQFARSELRSVVGFLAPEDHDLSPQSALPVRGHTCAPLSVGVVNPLTVGSRIGHFVMAITLADACDDFANAQNRTS